MKIRYSKNKTMRSLHGCIMGICSVLFVLINSLVCAQPLEPYEVTQTKLKNPITAAYLTRNISKQSPKLILTPSIEKKPQKEAEA